MTINGHRRPQQEENTATRTATEATEQTISLNTTQAARALGVDSKTVRRYVTDGIRTVSGTIVHLHARQVRSNRGSEWLISQTDLETFKQVRDQQATEGKAVGQPGRPESRALPQVLAAELERRSQALSRAQETIERLAREAGRSTELERERDALQRRVAELEAERATQESLREHIAALEAKQEQQAEQLRRLEERLAEREPQRVVRPIPPRPVVLRPMNDNE